MNDSIKAADMRAATARAHLNESVKRVRQRLTPVNLLADGVRSVSLRATDALNDAAGLARKRPTAVIGSAIALGAVFALKRKLSPNVSNAPDAPVVIVKPRRKLTVAKVANGIILAAQIASTLRGDKPKR
jgi:ElaB/YqjD/DUF883 family membrane-anchored ribosome-binding protein